MSGQIPERLVRRLYSFSEADRLAGATRGTAKRWIQGYAYQRQGKRVQQPPVTPGTGESLGATFLDLIEIVVIARLKELGFSLAEVRSIVQNCQDILGVSRPLGTLTFKTGGGEVFVQRDGHLIEVGRRKRMLAWRDVLEPFLQELDYAGEWVERWWPLGKLQPIIIDPDYGFGQPVIAGSGVRTEIILERVKAGDLPDEIASDFNVTPVEVHRAIQFEATRAA